MRKAMVLKAFNQERLWLVANLFGAAYYVVKTRQFLTPSFALAPNGFSFLDAVLPVLEVSFIANLLWAALVIFAVSRRRKTVNNLLTFLSACMLWVGTILYIDFRTGRAIDEVQEQELPAQSSTGKTP